MTTDRVVTTGVQDDRSHASRLAVLRTPELLAKWPMIGVLMFIFGILVFAGLTYDLFAHGPLLQWDQVIATTWPAMALKTPPFVKPLVDSGFYLGYQVVMILALPLALYLMYRRFWEELAMLVAGLVGQSVLFISLSNLIGRPRPPTQIWIVVHVPGFPSGHTMTVVVFYGLLAYWLAPKMPTTFWKVVVAAVALFIIVFVGFTRIFSAGHYLTDILAGYALGIALFGGAYTLVETYYRRRRSQHVNQE